MLKIVALHGTGDCYLLCALLDAFERHHNRPAELVIKGKYACIAQMFGVRYSVDDALIAHAEADAPMQRDYDNVIAEDKLFYAHPSFWRTNIRVDHLTTKPDVSQADMYKILLRIPPDAPLKLPNKPEIPMEQGKVVVVPDARSWPNLHPGFWGALIQGLASAGWRVIDNNKSGWSLREFFINCASAEWVIGPQCGIMSILVTGRYPCRKTLATPDVDHDPRFRFSQLTFPYGYVTKFSNQDYDVEEFKITAHNHGELVDNIVNGSNALRLWPHDPNPVLTIDAPVTPGDFLDRLAVLTVKRDRFPRHKRAAIEREYQRYNELRIRHPMPPETAVLFARLVDNHSKTFDLLERMVPAAIEQAEMATEDHVAAVLANRERIELKQAIDAACHAPYTESKSYYGDETK